METKVNASEIASARVPAESLPLRVCGHLYCLQNMTERHLPGESRYIPCFEMSHEHFQRMYRRALESYRLSRLVTVEKNPGPTRKSEGERERQPSREQEVVEVLVQWLELFGFDSSGYSIAGDVRQWKDWIADSGDWMKLCKYKLAVFLPVCTEGLFGGQRNASLAFEEDEFPSITLTWRPGWPIHQADDP